MLNFFVFVKPAMFIFFYTIHNENYKTLSIAYVLSNREILNEFFYNFDNIKEKFVAYIPIKSPKGIAIKRKLR